MHLERRVGNQETSGSIVERLLFAAPGAVCIEKSLRRFYRVGPADEAL